MDDTFERISDYLTGLVPERPAEMQAMEAYAARHRFPIIGPVAGQLCYQIARMIGARRIFELGSGYGYSTAWFARAVLENGGGTVHHVVWDEDLSKRAQGHLNALGYRELIRYRVGEAVQTLRETEGPFDLIFNDIDKTGYPESWPVIADKLRPGGVAITDNMFMGGRVLDPGEAGAGPEAVRDYTRLATGDPNWVTTIAPLRDGLLISFRC